MNGPEVEITPWSAPVEDRPIQRFHTAVDTAIENSWYSGIVDEAGRAYLSRLAFISFDISLTDARTMVDNALRERGQ